MELISYASDFVSFIIQNSKNTEKINSIILFGSVARKQATKESDIDLFIDVSDNEQEIEKEVNKILQDFYKSIKYKNYWSLYGINNEFSIIVGKINEWKLKDSMLGNSLVLYGKYSPKLDDGENKTIISWETIKNNSKRVMLNKKLFGFKHYKHKYKGLIEIYHGVKLGTNSILIDTGNINIFIKEFKKFQVKTRIINAFKYKD
jgi:predicted nucleotidyltransferase